MRTIHPDRTECPAYARMLREIDVERARFFAAQVEYEKSLPVRLAQFVVKRIEAAIDRLGPQFNRPGLGCSLDHAFADDPKPGAMYVLMREKRGVPGKPSPVELYDDPVDAQAARIQAAKRLCEFVWWVDEVPEAARSQMRELLAAHHAQEQLQ